MSVRAFLLSALLLGACDRRPGSAPQPEPVPQLPLISLCELATNPASFSGREVRIRTVYRVGFEWSEFYSLKCLDEPGVWVELALDYADCSDTAAVGLINHTHEATLGIVARGRLEGYDKPYGHEGGYRMQFNIDCLESATLLDELSYHRRSLTNEMRQRILAFENSR